MWDKAVLAEAIAAHRLAAAEALARVQPGRHPPDTPETYAAAAALLQRAPEEIWVDQLEHLGLLDAFGAALQAQGVGLEPPPRFTDSVAPTKPAVFGSRARAVRVLGPPGSGVPLPCAGQRRDRRQRLPDRPQPRAHGVARRRRRRARRASGAGPADPGGAR